MRGLLEKIDDYLLYLDKSICDISSIVKEIEFYKSIYSNYEKIGLLDSDTIKSSFKKYRGKIDKNLVSSILSCRLLVKKENYNMSFFQIDSIRNYCNIIISELNKELDNKLEKNREIDKIKRIYLRLKSRINKNDKILSVNDVKLIEQLISKFELKESIDVIDYIIRQQEINRMTLF